MLSLGKPYADALRRKRAPRPLRSLAQACQKPAPLHRRRSDYAPGEKYSDRKGTQAPPQVHHETEAPPRVDSTRIRRLSNLGRNDPGRPFSVIVLADERGSTSVNSGLVSGSNLSGCER